MTFLTQLKTRIPNLLRLVIHKLATPKRTVVYLCKLDSVQFGVFLISSDQFERIICRLS